MFVFRRPWHHICIDALREALTESRLSQRDHWADFNADQLAELYESARPIHGLTVNVDSPSAESDGWNRSPAA